MIHVLMEFLFRILKMLTCIIWWIMKLLFNEFIKLWNKPSVIISVLLLIVVNSGLWFISMSVQQSNSYNYKDYIVLKSSYDSKPLQDAFESINETVHNLESYKQYEVYQSIPDVIPSKEEFFDEDRKSTRLNSSHVRISYAVFCLKKKKVRASG